jgi:hypothetical protein
MFNLIFMEQLNLKLGFFSKIRTSVTQKILSEKVITSVIPKKVIEFDVSKYIQINESSKQLKTQYKQITKDVLAFWKMFESDVITISDLLTKGTANSMEIEEIR